MPIDILFQQVEDSLNHIAEHLDCDERLEGRRNKTPHISADLEESRVSVRSREVGFYGEDQLLDPVPHIVPFKELLDVIPLLDGYDYEADAESG